MKGLIIAALIVLLGTLLLSNITGNNASVNIVPVNTEDVKELPVAFKFDEWDKFVEAVNKADKEFKKVR